MFFCDFKRCGIFAALGLLFAVGAGKSPAAAPALPAVPALSTEDFLNTLGVNTHLNGLTAGDPWDTDAARVGKQLKYLGVRLDRDWAWSAADGDKWKAVQTAWGPYGRFWTSLDEGSPETQRRNLELEESIYGKYPNLIAVMGGPNEEDDTYPQQQGATLPDSVRVQQSLYDWAHSGGRAVPTSQMEFGAGWTAANNWQGDYNPQNTGIHQNYSPAPAEIGGAHTYISSPQERPVDVLNHVRMLAQLTTPGRPVAHTEFGAYSGAHLSAAVYGQYLVMGALDSAAAGDTGYLVYGLQDSAPESCYGFYTYPGGVPHEAAVYYHTLTTLLASTRGGYTRGVAPTFAPGSLFFSTDGPAVSHLLMQKPTGEFVVAAWSEQRMDGMEQPVSETIHFGRTFAAVKVYNVENGPAPLAALRNAAGYTLRMKPSDTYLLVLTGGKSAVQGNKKEKKGNLK